MELFDGLFKKHSRGHFLFVLGIVLENPSEISSKVLPEISQILHGTLQTFSGDVPPETVSESLRDVYREKSKNSFRTID